jgi:hypothetical protein
MHISNLQIPVCATLTLSLCFPGPHFSTLTSLQCPPSPVQKSPGTLLTPHRHALLIQTAASSSILVFHCQFSLTCAQPPSERKETPI